MDQSLARNTIERAVLDALKTLRFGSLEIIVHDSKVVRIERKEKIRIDTPDNAAREKNER